MLGATGRDCVVTSVLHALEVATNVYLYRLSSFMGGLQLSDVPGQGWPANPKIQSEFTMTMTTLIGVAGICDALEEVLPRLSPATGDAVQFLLDVIPDQSRFLCFVPVRAGCVAELCAHGMCVSDHAAAGTRAGDADLVSVPAGWVVLPGPEASAWQARWLVQSIEAFHFFAPLHESELEELAHVDEQLAGTVKTLQRIRPAVTDELFGEALALISPVAFTALPPGVIHVEAIASDCPQCCSQRGANGDLLSQSMFVLLHAPGTTIDVDPLLGRARGLIRPVPTCASAIFRRPSEGTAACAKDFPLARSP